MGKLETENLFNIKESIEREIQKTKNDIELVNLPEEKNRYYHGLLVGKVMGLESALNVVKLIDADNLLREIQKIGASRFLS